ncbi:lipoprotein [Microtetraspora sp. NBRC 13810]|uniref:hypothetical protein n=1 Tax=Microtetraspora sp. NBRC 13810 TaxID=3030990 RepID=UPI0024A24F91|nr:hypothetical protein [Microtetraspora sp. NBRC 13810]GLW10952.1 lipoprotein [Microtetraspora sp. NBRC 13810]
MRRRWKPWLVAAAALPVVAGCAHAEPDAAPAPPRPPAGAAPGSTAGAAPQSPAEPAAERPAASAAGREARPGVKVPPGTTAGYVVFDRRTGKITAQRNAHRPFRSASVVKILIAVDHLERAGSVPDSDAALLRVMLRSSDDDAATTFWNRGGRKQIIQRMARKLGLSDTAPPPDDLPGFWGYTSISAHDIAKTYRYLFDRADPKVRGLVLGHLRKATKCGSDGFDQSFGIPDAISRPWAVKQGWSGFGTTPPVRCGGPSAGRPPLPQATAVTPAQQAVAVTPARQAGTVTPARQAVAVTPARQAGNRAVPDYGRPVLHTTGIVGRDDRLIMVLLTAHPAGSSWRDSVRRTTALAAAVHRSGRP